MPSHMTSSARIAALAMVAMAALIPLPGHARTQVAANVSVPLSDARGIGADSVRFGAAQDTGSSPSIALFGLAKESWARVRDAIQLAVAQGYPVRAIFIGPTNAPASLEIYAKGAVVTVDGIDPNRISGPELTTLIRDIHREYYARR